MQSRDVGWNRGVPEGGEAVFCRKLAAVSGCGIGARGVDLRRVACFKERREGGVAERDGGGAVEV